MDSNFIKGALI